MNNISKYLNKSIYLLFLFPLFKENISSLILIIFFLLTLLFLKLNNIKFNIKKEIFFYSIPFLIILLTSIFDNYFDIDFKIISKNMLFIYFPLVFLQIPDKYFIKLESGFLYYFKYACIIVCTYYIISFISTYSFNSFFLESYNESIYRRYVYNEVLIFKIHPTYFSLFLNFGILHSLIQLKKERKYLNLFIIVFFLLNILLLSSKLILVLSLISISIIFIYNSEFLNKKYLFGLVLLFCVSFFIIPGIKSRFVEMYTDFSKKPIGMYYNSTNIRKSIIECSISILKENYIRGVGFNNIQNELNNCYKSNYESNFYDNHNYLTHNYFMYIILGAGVFGFICFIFYLYILFKKIKQINNLFLYLIFFNCLILFLFEDFLFRHYGLYVFNLFIFSYFKFSENKI